MKTEPYEPASPCAIEIIKTGFGGGKFRDTDYYSGLSKREYFASMAMQGLSANTNLNYPSVNIAQAAVLFADSLINELNKQQP